MLRFVDRPFIRALVAGAIYFAIAFVIQTYAVAFATANASNSVTDVILSNTPVLAVGDFFVYGTVACTLLAILATLVHSRRAPFVLKGMALFVFIRSFFVSLTHVNPFPQEVVISPNFITNLFPSIFTGKDLFFSGHTGVPFFMALIFWEYPFWRVLFLGFSIFFAFVVLLGHLHYSIDVAAAYFITYSIFVLAQRLFASDWRRTQSA